MLYPYLGHLNLCCGDKVLNFVKKNPNLLKVQIFRVFLEYEANMKTKKDKLNLS